MAGRNVVNTAPFRERLIQRISEVHSRLCVGLDPRPGRIDGDVEEFLEEIVESVAPMAAAFKPNIAYFEAMGVRGYGMLADLINYIPDSIPVILDVKRSDIPETQKYYARAYFDQWGVDAVTLNPFMGSDSLEPFLERSGKGVFLLSMTSNPGAEEIQLIRNNGDYPVFNRISKMATPDEERTSGAPGMVIGLTNLNDRMIEHIPDVPLLVPGLGSQGGKLQRLVDLDHSSPILVNSSRSVLYAEGIQGTVETAKQYRERINDVIGG